MGRLRRRRFSESSPVAGHKSERKFRVAVAAESPGSAQGRSRISRPLPTVSVHLPSGPHETSSSDGSTDLEPTILPVPTHELVAYSSPERTLTTPYCLIARTDRQPKTNGGPPTSATRSRLSRPLNASAHSRPSGSTSMAARFWAQTDLAGLSTMTAGSRCSGPSASRTSGALRSHGVRHLGEGQAARWRTRASTPSEYETRPKPRI